MEFGGYFIRQVNSTIFELRITLHLRKMENHDKKNLLYSSGINRCIFKLNKMPL